MFVFELASFCIALCILFSLKWAANYLHFPFIWLSDSFPVLSSEVEIFHRPYEFSRSICHFTVLSGSHHRRIAGNRLKMLCALQKSSIISPFTDRKYYLSKYIFKTASILWTCYSTLLPLKPVWTLIIVPKIVSCLIF